MPAEVLYCGQPGSLPFTVNYTPKSNSPVLVQVQGTVYGKSGTTGGIGLRCSIDGTVFGDSPIWSNAPEVHRTTFPLTKMHKFDLFEHGQRDSVQITIDVMSSNTVFDGNDLLSILIIE